MIPKQKKTFRLGKNRPPRWYWYDWNQFEDRQRRLRAESIAQKVAEDVKEILQRYSVQVK